MTTPGPTLAPEERRRTLEAFARVLRRETQVVSRQPDLLWQQLYNRLQWSDEAVRRLLERRLSDKAAPGSAPWLRMKTGFRESEALVAILQGHTGEVYACAISPDGSLIVSAGTDAVRLWDAVSGSELRTLDDAGGYACAFSPDGRRIVGGSLKVWDVDGQELCTLEGHEDTVDACEFSPDGRRIVSASPDGTLRLWDTETGRQLRTLGRRTTEVLDCAFSPNGTRIVSAGHDGPSHWLTLRDAETGRKLRILENHADDVSACAFSPDGSRIVSAGDQTLKIWDARTGMELHALEGYTDQIRDCAFSPDGSRIVSVGWDGTVRLWDAESGKELGALTGHISDEVQACAFSADGRQIVSAGFDRTVRLWDAEGGDEARTRGHEAAIWGCAFSPDGRLIVSASEDQTLKLWDAISGRELRILKGHKSAVHDCAFSPDSSLIVSVGDDGLKLWNAASGRELGTLSAAGSHSCAFSPDGALIISDFGDILTLWDALSGEELRTLEGHRSDIWDYAFSPDGSLIVTASEDFTVRLWDTATGRAVRTLVSGHRWADVGIGGVAYLEESHPDPVYGCAFSPDGHRVVSASSEMVRIWDVETGRLLHTLHRDAGWALEPWGGSAPRDACAFSPDGSWVVSAGYDGTVKLWDAESGEASATLPLLDLGTSVALHPWLPLAVCGDQTGGLYLIDLVGIEYGAIVVTAVDLGHGPTVRCPACLECLQLERGQLGQEIECPDRNCDQRLRVNPFVVVPYGHASAARGQEPAKGLDPRVSGA